MLRDENCETVGGQVRSWQAHDSEYGHGIRVLYSYCWWWQGIVCPIICCAMICTEYGDLSGNSVHAEVTVQVQYTVQEYE